MSLFSKALKAAEKAATKKAAKAEADAVKKKLVDTMAKGTLAKEKAAATRAEKLQSMPAMHLDKATQPKTAYSGIKGYTPLDDIGAVYGNPLERVQPMTPIRIEDLEGKIVRGMQTDRSHAGTTLQGLLGQNFGEGVSLRGGYEFPSFNPHAWASEKGIASTTLNRAGRDIADAEGGDVINVGLGMKPQTGMDFSHMPAQTLLQMVHANQPPDATLRAFDEMMRKKYPDFPGLMNIDNQYLADAGGKFRTMMTQEMDAEGWLRAGMPEVGVARKAVTAPYLDNPIDLRTGQSMQYPTSSFVRLDPTQKITPGDHPSYSSNIPGTLVGKLDMPVPANLLFGDFMAGKDPSAIGKIMAMSPPKTEITPEVIERVLKYQDLINNPQGQVTGSYGWLPPERGR